MGITYNDLAQKLQELEKRFRVDSTQIHSGSAKNAIRHKNNFQCFALDTTTSSNNSELPVVIAVGANYTQGNQALPTNSTFSAAPGIEANLSSGRKNFESFLEPVRQGLVVLDDDHYNSGYAKEIWHTTEGKINIYTNAGFREDQLFKGAPCKPNWSHLPKNGNYHLVMTNFCPFITQESWSVYRDEEPWSSQELIAFGLSVGHLNAIQKELETSTKLWIGHGNFDIYYHFFTYLVRGYLPIIPHLKLKKFSALKKHEWLFTVNSSQQPFGKTVCG